MDERDFHLMRVESRSLIQSEKESFNEVIMRLHNKSVPDLKEPLQIAIMWADNVVSSGVYMTTSSVLSAESHKDRE
jgi:hypothetical protein